MTTAEREAWLAARRTGIGSSDAPNLVGVGYETAHDVWEEKLGRRPDREPEGRLRRGLVLEKTVAAEYERATGVPLALAPPARHPDHAFLMASPDRVRPDGRLVELKTVCHFGHAWGESGSDQVPEGYLVQVTHQMAVRGADVCELAALDVDSFELRLYRVEFDARLWGVLLDAAATFWHGHVRAEPAPVDPGGGWEFRYHPAVMELVPPSGTAKLDAAAAAVAADYCRYRAAEKAAAEARERCRDELMGLMGDAAQADAGGYRLTRSLVAGVTYTTTRAPAVQLRVTEPKERKAVRG